MMHSKTDEKYFKEVIKFAENINMIALPLRKEKSGYLLNSMLIPLLFSGLDLLVNGISDIESIDNWLENNKENIPDNSYKGIYKGNNVIYIQVESLENWVINTKIKS